MSNHWPRPTGVCSRLGSPRDTDALLPPHRAAQVLAALGAAVDRLAGTVMLHYATWGLAPADELVLRAAVSAYPGRQSRCSAGASAHAAVRVCRDLAATQVLIFGRRWSRTRRPQAAECGCDHDIVPSEDRPPGARIAEAVDRLRRHGVAVEATTRAGVTTYVVERSAYRAEIVVDPARWLGVELVLLSDDRVVDLRYRVDTDLYNIYLDRYRWFAAEIETEIVVLLDGLAQGKVLVDRTSPRPSMIVPSSDGPLLVRRRRLGAGTDWYAGDIASGPPPGFRSLDP